MPQSMADQNANSKRVGSGVPEGPAVPPDPHWTPEQDSSQLLDPPGVSTGVGSIAIKANVLPGQRLTQSGRFVVTDEVRRQRLEDPNDDASIMMRVSAGDDAAFD